MKIDIEYDESRTKRKLRNTILNKSFELFLEHGIENVSIIDIARECHIHRRTLYNYYDQKEQIALDLMKCWYKNLAVMMRREESSQLSGFETLKNSFIQLYIDLVSNQDMIAYSVHFDHYFQHGYDNSAFASFVEQTVVNLDDVASFKRGIEDGSINPKYAANSHETLLAITGSILGIAQRIMFRPKEMEREGGNTPERILLLIDVIFEGLASPSSA